MWRPLLSLALLLTACTHSKRITAPTGGEGYAIDCYQITDCYAEAGEVCSNGYDMSHLGREQNGRHSMVIACRD
jgi:hypothetical protein